MNDEQLDGYQQEFRRIREAVQLELDSSRNKLHTAYKFYNSQFHLGQVAALENILHIIDEPEQGQEQS